MKEKEFENIDNNEEESLRSEKEDFLQIGRAHV